MSTEKEKLKQYGKEESKNHPQIAPIKDNITNVNILVSILCSRFIDGEGDVKRDRLSNLSQVSELGG